MGFGQTYLPGTNVQDDSTVERCVADSLDRKGLDSDVQTIVIIGQARTNLGQS
jgi:hypothetical protein